MVVAEQEHALESGQIKTGLEMKSRLERPIAILLLEYHATKDLDRRKM
jgi:hypothetical protein